MSMKFPCGGRVNGVLVAYAVDLLIFKEALIDISLG